jgi:hypothetical protein
VTNSDEQEICITEDGLPASIAVASFAESELVSCTTCQRKNPPIRSKCLYCGAALSLKTVTFDRPRCDGRKLEVWEKGWNVVAQPTARKNIDVSAIAEMFGLEMDVCKPLIESQVLLPVARVETEAEASLWSDKLRQMEVDTFVLADERLSSEMRPRRVRSISLGETEIEFVDFNSNLVTRMPGTEIALIVSGKIHTSTNESLEKRSRGKSENIAQLDSSNEEGVIDIYPNSDRIGFRILASGFDFSFLGDQKSRLSGENVVRTISMLENMIPNAKLISTFGSVRSLLTAVWGLDVREETAGPRRAGFLKAEMERKMVTTNWTQFTKFSRLQAGYL